MQLETIPKAEHANVIHCYWMMMQELRTQADNDNDPVLKVQVEAYYRLWNRVTGDDKTPTWSKQ